MVSFSCSCSPKLSVSITTDQIARSRLISGKNYSLGGQEPENETNNFSHFSLGCATLNWIMTAKVVGLILRLFSSETVSIHYDRSIGAFRIDSHGDWHFRRTITVEQEQQLLPLLATSRHCKLDDET